MRHLGSLLAGLLIAPLAWLLLAAGQARTAATFARWERADTIYTGDLLAPLGLAAAAGVLIGLVATLRWSPLGPLVAGLGFLAGYGYAFAEPFRLVDLLPVWHVAGNRVDLGVPLTNGTLAVLGAALVMAVFSAKRWRRWPARVTAPAGAGADIGVGTGTGPAIEGVPEPSPPFGGGAGGPALPGDPMSTSGVLWPAPAAANAGGSHDGAGRAAPSVTMSVPIFEPAPFRPPDADPPLQSRITTDPSGWPTLQPAASEPAQPDGPLTVAPMPRSATADTAEDLPRRAAPPRDRPTRPDEPPTARPLGPTPNGSDASPAATIPAPRPAPPDDATADGDPPAGPAPRPPIRPTYRYPTADGTDGGTEGASGDPPKSDPPKSDPPEAPPANGSAEQPPEPPFTSPWAGPPRPPSE